MDRKAWFAIIFSAIGMVVWYWYMAKLQPPPPAQAPAAVASATPAAPTATPAPAAALSADESTIPAETESLYTSSAEYVFENNFGGIDQVLLYKHQGELDRNITLNEKDALSIGALGLEAGTALGGFSMQADPKKGDVHFTKLTKDGVEITKHFRVLPEDGKELQYLLELEISFKNTGNSEVYFPAYYISTGRAAPVHISDMPLYTRFDWMRDTRMTNIDVNWFNAGHIPIIGQTSPEKSEYKESGEKIEWAAVTTQYFCSILSAQPANGNSVWAKRYVVRVKNNTPTYGLEGALGFSAVKIAAGETVTQKLTVFAGPKDYGLLKKMGGNQQDLMNFGWFKVVSIFLLWAMNKFYALLGSYALAIIALTICIKLAMWPLQNKATNSMKKMAALSPKMTELRQKYKDDPTKMNEELMKLYREYNVNPFSGCLPMLIQIPIFFGFYSMLGTAIELRGSSFLWVKDLSLPDTVFSIPIPEFQVFGMHIGPFLPVNVLPIIMAVTMVWQMAITPKTGDATQQRFMLFMPVIFIAFCYNYASGLSLYWTTQNIFSIVQLYFTRNKIAPKLEKKSDIARKEAGGAKKKQKRKK